MKKIKKKRLKNLLKILLFDWDACTEFVEFMTKCKVADHPSLSNKVVFKFMDLEEEF